jgi:hypothetical protein
MTARLAVDSLIIEQMLKGGRWRVNGMKYKEFVAAQ